ncbi:hypothetical protein [Clostridium aminobutyricum]|uniref:Rubrerythrin diiron-binding domain-containing protein n=1 Tax=Clostridium aminobutyricum TaxID=33953 RepID=A0A939D6B5_CLOAM|nr:hypothetical protein [Clostridium aminobutyricum]MBN7771860.1 hypothetical protein [Clostridium aminobutyricum]
MKMTTEDYLKKALLDTQERVRDFMDISYEVKNPEVKQFLREYAATEGLHAQELKDYLETGKVR